MLYVQDEVLEKQNLGIFWEIPGWTHPDFFKFLLLQKIMGTFEKETFTEQAGDTFFQNSLTNEIMRQIPELEKYDAQFCPFTDTGVFGHYL